MTDVLTADQMRRMERGAIDSGDVTGLGMMEKAGQGVVHAVFRHWPALAQGTHRAVVLCGPGNNGGDGFVVARVLQDAGWQVAVYFYGRADRLPPDARANYDVWRERGPVLNWAPEEIEEALIDACDLAVDAVFGTGMRRPMVYEDSHDVHDGLRTRVSEGCPCVAVDMPTGLSADTGQTLGYCFPTLLTVTFHKPKLGHYLEEGPLLCHRLEVCDIGLGKRWLRAAPQLVAPPFGALEKQQDAHKFSHGHAVVLTGGSGRTGAARLAARAALRVGAGLVTLAAPGGAMQEVACQITALMLKRVDTGSDLARLLEDKRITALCLGPGLGLAEGRGDLVGAALSSKRKLILDADACTLIAGSEALFDALHSEVVLTPHGGEFARLFPDLAKQLDAEPAYTKLDATRDAAARAGCTILFKGPDTVIATPQGHAELHAAAYDQAAPWLATAGSGDVLAGLIAGLLARGELPVQAAAFGAWLHAACARRFGPGLIAEDLPDQLPGVLRELGL